MVILTKIGSPYVQVSAEYAGFTVFTWLWKIFCTYSKGLSDFLKFVMHLAGAVLKMCMGRRRRLTRSITVLKIIQKVHCHSPFADLHSTISFLSIVCLPDNITTAIQETRHLESAIQKLCIGLRRKAAKSAAFPTVKCLRSELHTELILPTS